MVCDVAESIAFPSSFNSWRAIAPDYFTCCEVPLVSAHLSEAMQEYPDAANEIKAWVAIVEGVRWHNFAEARLMFGDADYINGYVVFNIRRDRYRLITVMHYAKTTDEKRTEGHVIRSFLTHKEYDDPRKWDRRFGAK